MKYSVFDIQRNSFVDGPGIRTTVFFSGCNLRCKWCHNPEGLTPDKKILFYKDKCLNCYKCVSVCKEKAVLSPSAFNLKACTFCKECESLCPASAIRLSGKDYTLDELFEIIKCDLPFYRASGGGVTFSGGECMLNYEGLTEILKICAENNIHTAVDTAGNVPFEHFKAVIPYTNLFLYDVKCFSPALHKEFTGVDNALILENLKALSATQEIIVRTPIIPGFNDNIDELTKIAHFLKDLGITNWELLPYHILGESKYQALNMAYSPFSVPQDSLMNELNKVKELL